MSTSVYDEVGGQEFFDRLCAAFYRRVAGDPVLRPLYPDEDLGDAERHLAGFLAQYWGGPTTYSDARGHPRLRMRHAPFRIGPAERDAWFAHMAAALDEVRPPEDVEARMLDYFAMAADAMVNT